MNVGRIHGVKEGDKLKLWHSASFIESNGYSKNSHGCHSTYPSR
ncbi:FlgT C-terminal domain-containing protein [Photobacterium damselae subsp. piscicida]|nr:FlgT C-terminal domain-containing protein [Photobacterium damselae subsp. piscicida]